jgi:hypothetical protein
LDSCKVQVVRETSGGVLESIRASIQNFAELAAIVRLFQYLTINDVETFECFRCQFIGFAQPDQGIGCLGVHLPHESDLMSTLAQVPLVNTDSIYPEYSFLVRPSKIPQDFFCSSWHPGHLSIENDTSAAFHETPYIRYSFVH